MPAYLKSDAGDFAQLGQFVKPHEATGRTESAALLIWYLETIFRLDSIEAQDAVCDKKHDAGIDAVCVKDDQKELVLFQAKRKQKLPATLGDTDLKEFVGSLQQFQTEQAVKKLIAKTANDELRNLLQNNNVAEKIGKGYAIRAVFLCNIAANDDATRYLEHASEAGHKIDL
jgi:beta-glucosidase-like glycosyl hydrolase